MQTRPRHSQARLVAAAVFCGSMATGLAASAVPFGPGPREKPAQALDLAPALAQGLDRPASRRARLPEHVLVLLVDFSDQPHASNETPAVFDSAFFGRAPGSVRDYYVRSSFGRLHLAGQVTSWLRLPRRFAEYADAARGGRGVLGTYPNNARRMVEDAVRAADAQVDYRAFDDDGPDGVPSSGDDDGRVDALIVVHSGPAAELGDAAGILSHNWFTQGTVQTADGPYAWNYATVATSSPLGVRAHEFGHTLGLIDLYDRRSTSRLGGGLGDWSLMASGAWLGGGDTPGDLDATSKIDLGFVDPIVVSTQAGALPLRAPHDGSGPDVYRVWTHGLPAQEYFVLENRRPTGLDAALPGGGMLVYHVDLTRAYNDDAEHPRVQLLQADGREQIERRINNGDSGDPFPGDRGVVRLDSVSAPGTRARDGRDTQVVLSAISTPTANMSLQVQVDTGPELVAQRAGLLELDGDGDTVPEAGERLGLDLELRNLGLPSGGFTLQIEAVPAGDASWFLDRLTLGSLAKLDSTPAHFELRAAAGLPDPFGLTLRGSATGSDWSQTFELVVPLGTHTGLLACMQPESSRFTRDCSDPAQPWTTAALRGAGCWSRETPAGEFGSVYRSACGALYADDADAVLVSPAFNLLAGCELRLLHAYDCEEFEAGWGHDGGWVELSLDGGVWEALAPRGGYPRRLWRDTLPAFAGAGIFSGRSPRRWDVFDLGARTGSARLRFRFVSNSRLGSSGWEVARVEVGPPQSAPLRALGLIAEPNPVRFPARVAFRIVAPLTQAARPTTLQIYDARGRLVRSLSHVPVPAESGRFEWDGTDRAGHRVASGLYVARLEWGSDRSSCKLLVLR